MKGEAEWCSLKKCNCSSIFDYFCKIKGCEYAGQLNQIILHASVVSYLVEVRIVIALFYHELKHESSTFGRIVLEQPTEYTQKFIFN
jgi:hypothetical protein